MHNLKKNLGIVSERDTTYTIEGLEVARCRHWHVMKQFVIVTYPIENQMLYMYIKLLQLRYLDMK